MRFYNLFSQDSLMFLSARQGFDLIHQFIHLSYFQGQGTKGMNLERRGGPTSRLETQVPSSDADYYPIVISGDSRVSWLGEAKTAQHRMYFV
jgi:hypothetical protein